MFLQGLVHGQSFDQVNRLAKLLADEPTYVTQAQMRRLRRAQKENNQVEDAFDVDWAFRRLETKLGSTPATPSVLVSSSDED